MAEKSASRAFDDDDGSIDVRPLLRLGAWGGCAVIALGAAVFTSRTDIGEQRAAYAIAAIGKAAAEPSTSPAAEQLLARATAAENEAKRLAETVRQLAADRDQLVGRLASVERNLDDLTGSIAKGPARTGTTAAVAAPEPSAPATTAAAIGGPAAAVEPEAPRAVPMPVPRPGPMALIQSYVSPGISATQTSPAEPAREFAVDLGGAGSLDALRLQWNHLKARHAALLDGLQPLVLARSPRPGVTERRLIVGPLANTTAVARVCAALSASGTSCAPAVYDGQRLALR